MKQKPTAKHWLRPAVARLGSLHLLYAGFLILQTVIFDAWQIITPEGILRRWIMMTVLVVVAVTTWYLAKSKLLSLQAYKALVFALIVVDIGVASFGVYSERGMASRAVALYAIPIIVTTVLRSKSALFVTATLCAVAYTVTAVAYFVLNFNEGYKTELYGIVGFYSACFYLLAYLLWVIVRSRKSP